MNQQLHPNTSSMEYICQYDWTWSFYSSSTLCLLVYQAKNAYTFVGSLVPPPYSSITVLFPRDPLQAQVKESLLRSWFDYY